MLSLENPNAPMLENADPAGALLGIAIGAVVIVGIVWALKSESETKSAPSPEAPTACPSFDTVSAFALSKGYHVWYVENQSVTTWKTPKPEYASDPEARAWSAIECGFFAYLGGAWVPDVPTNADLAAFRTSQVSRPRLLMTHPLEGIIPALG